MLFRSQFLLVDGEDEDVLEGAIVALEEAAAPRMEPAAVLTNDLVASGDAEAVARFINDNAPYFFVPRYIEFVVFHLGVFANIAISFVIAYAPDVLTAPVRAIGLIVFAAAFIAGSLRLYRRAARPEMRVIFMSGYAEVKFREHGEKAEDFHFLPKPFGLKQLVAKVKDVLSGAEPPASAPMSNSGDAGG